MIFRRGLRLWLPTAVALAIIKILSSTIGTGHIEQYKRETGNISLQVPYEIPNTLAYFNSVFNLFWPDKQLYQQAANTAFPSQTLWTINVIYSQSYTVYLSMIIIPCTRPPWRVKAYLCFIISAWWVQSWAWYSISGLLLTDAVVNMRYIEKAKRRLRIWRFMRLPIWILFVSIMAAGLALQYLWTDWRPKYNDRELLAHAGRYYSGGLNTRLDAKEPQARDDNYLLILGFHLLLERFIFAQKMFDNTFFLYLGKRSLSMSFFLFDDKVDSVNNPLLGLPACYIADGLLPIRLVSCPESHHLYRRHQALPKSIKAAKSHSRVHKGDLFNSLRGDSIPRRGSLLPLSGLSVENISALSIQLDTGMKGSGRWCSV